MRYENELCPGCGNTFTEYDDTVVCPVCGTPQHRQCWHEHGGCVNASLHAQGYVWKFSEASPDEKIKDGFNAATDTGVICSVCGTNNPANAETCSACKNQLNAPPPASNAPEKESGPVNIQELPFMRNSGISPDEVIGGIKANDIALYTQIGAGRYIEKFRRLVTFKKKFSWNWAAFFFSPYWFFYRKLYWLGGIFLGLKLAIAVFFAAPVMELQNVLNSFPGRTLTQADLDNIMTQSVKYYPAIMGMLGLTFLTHFIATLVANYAYKKKVFTEVTSIRRFAKDEKVFQMLTLRRGGASPLALMGSVLAYDLILYAVDAFVRGL